MKHLLIVFHSQTGRTARLARAVARGAADPNIDGVAIQSLRASDAGPADLLWADAVLLGTPENFGYMSGAIKDFFDRTFYAVAGQAESLPYAVFVSAGNDGSGALGSLQRIASGYPFREVQPAVIVKGNPSDEDIQRCEELGASVAAGLELGVF